MDIEQFHKRTLRIWFLCGMLSGELLITFLWLIFSLLDFLLGIS